MNDLKDLDRRLWETANQLRANSTLTPGQYRERGVLDRKLAELILKA